MASPLETFTIGRVEAALFESEGSKDGKSWTSLNWKIRKRYQKDGEWRDTSYYNGLLEIYHLREAADEAIKRTIRRKYRGWGEQEQGGSFSDEGPGFDGETESPFNEENVGDFVSWVMTTFDLDESLATKLSLDKLGKLSEWTASIESAKNKLRVSQGLTPETPTGAKPSAL